MSNNKTLGKRSSHLLSSLYERGKVIFTIDDVSEITGLKYFSAGRLISELTKRKIISTLKKGKHIIIPREVGNIKRYLGNYYVAAREIINASDYYVGFYSAMHFRGMLTHPVNRVHIVAPKRQRVPKKLKGGMKIINVNQKYIWGITDEWVTKTEKVRFSNLEKTIVDSLAYPKYCGGITEIAGGIWITRDSIEFKKLYDYVNKFNRYVIGKRLGYILEILNLDEAIRKKLKKFVNKRYDLLDPQLPKNSINRNNWRLIDNVGKKEIKRIIEH
ncbi:MAG: hypothetical protein PF545_00015 [Elusimicrobia bacterium]|jgi:predicted transcriptional regulator of viral defense system|nr:hypothetical protein [Elusimicrobiota bacterium]